MSSLFSQSAGGRVILVLRRGACLSRKSLESELKMSTFSFVSSTQYLTTLKGTLLSSILKAVSSNCFSLRSNL